MSEIEYDVVIVGAGPAGSCTALELAKHNFRVALLDKATFPRDKICGDFVAGKGMRSLKEISPAAYERVLAFSEKAANKSTHLYVGNLSHSCFTGPCAASPSKGSISIICYLKKLWPPKNWIFFLVMV